MMKMKGPNGSGKDAALSLEINFVDHPRDVTLNFSPQNVA
jgi:hypothetical protein